MPHAFQQRSRGYQIGTLLLYAATILAAWGVIAPGWARSDRNIPNEVGYAGLWFDCYGSGYSNCVAIDFTGLYGYVYAIYILSVSSMLILVCGTIASLVLNFCTQVVIYRRTVHVLAIWGGIKLFVAAMVFVGDAESTMENDFSYWHYGPSFIIVVFSSILAFIAGIVIAANNTPYGVGFTRFAMGPKAVQVVYPVEYGYPPQQGNIFHTSG